MSRQPQSPEDLLEHLRDHLGFLQSSADAYDGGCSGEAKRMACSLRLLLHDTGRSMSLLGQLGMKNANFLDTGDELVPGNRLAYAGLVVTVMEPGTHSYFAAFLDDAPNETSVKRFDDWWKSPAIVDAQGATFRRVDVVLYIADQDGGAHVDSALDQRYADLSRNNSMGWTSHDGRSERPMGGAERATLRQICHEVLKTFVPEYRRMPKYPETAMLVCGQAMQIG